MKLKYVQNYPRQYAEFRSIIHSVFIYRFVQIKFIIINSRIDELYNVHVLSANRTDSTEYGVFFYLSLYSHCFFSRIFLSFDRTIRVSIYIDVAYNLSSYNVNFGSILSVLYSWAILNIAFIYVRFLLYILPIFICCAGIVTWFLFSVISLLFQHRPIEWHN